MTSKMICACKVFRYTCINMDKMPEHAFYCFCFTSSRIDPFTKKDWYDVKAPKMFVVRQIGKTLVTRTQGTSKYDVGRFSVIFGYCVNCGHYFKNGDGGILLIMRRGWVGDGGSFVRA